LYRRGFFRWTTTDDDEGGAIAEENLAARGQLASMARRRDD